MNLLLDASLPPRLARALHQLAAPEHRVEHVRDVLGNDASDQHIADYIAQQEVAVVIGIDLGITTTPHRIEQLLRRGCPSMLLHQDWMKLGVWDLSWQLAAVLPSVIRKREKPGSGLVFLIPPGHTGRIRKVA